LGLIVFAVCVLGLCTQAYADWYDQDWDYYQPITVSQANVTGTLTDFPLLVSITNDNPVFARAKADGSDIFFLSSDLVTRLSYEKEKYDPANSNLIYWVKIPTLYSDQDTVFYMYYGSTMSDTQNAPTNTWSDGYRLVHHLAETSAGPGDYDDHLDSSPYGNHGEVPGLTNDVIMTAAGQIDGARYFDGSTVGPVYCSNSLSLQVANAGFSVSGWCEAIPYNALGWIVTKGKGASTHPDNGWAVVHSSNGRIYFDVNTEVGRYIADMLYPATRYFFYAEYDGSGTMTLRVKTPTFDDTDDNKNVTGTISEIRPLLIGNSTLQSYPFDGIIDEIRVSDRVRSSAWFDASYNSQNDPDDFLTFGDEQLRPAQGTVLTIR